MTLPEPHQEQAKTPFDDGGKNGRPKHSMPPFMRQLPPGTLLGLSITAGALAVILFSAIIYRLTPQPKSPYLVTNPTPAASTARLQSSETATDIIKGKPEDQDDSVIPIEANESPEDEAARRLREERRIQERNIAEQRQLEDKKRAIERQIEDKQAEEKRRQEDKTIEDARELEDKKLMEAREAEDKKIADDRRLEAERKESERKLAATQPQ